MLRRFYRRVEGLTILRDDYVIPSGEFLTLKRVVLDSGFSKDTTVALVWDFDGGSQDIISFTHAHSELSIPVTIKGDGVKVISIILDNADVGTRWMGGMWESK